MKFYFLPLLLLIVMHACTEKGQDNRYQEEIEQWHQNRIASLTRPDGWTTLIGLHWLNEGSQTFGSAEQNDLVFPEKAPSFIGKLTLDADSVILELNDTVTININGTPGQKSLRLRADTESQTTYMNSGSLSWYLIHRGGKFGIRIKDSLSEQRLTLKSIPHYPIDENWRIKARLIPAYEGATIDIENILGQVSDNPLAGILEFAFQGKNYQISALDGGPDAYFLIIADETTGEETYGGGRYLYVDRADSTGMTYIDFNKAYNPPCVFSEFATCPLPPEENYLPFSITAGEKELPHH